jgi:catechol 2,3-dioxygenase-like lactoylglutathione lyase family enzyme
VKRVIILFAAAVLCPLAVWAQLEPPNEAGVSLGHWHTIVRDVNASKNFWIAMGGTALKIDDAEVIKFPGVFVFLTPGSPKGGSFGAVINHVGFTVPNDEELVTRLKAAGQTAEYVKSVFTGNYLGWAYTPDDLKIEIAMNKAQTVPLAIPHVHMWMVESAMPEAQAWYVKMFGGQAGPGTNGLRVLGIPGVSLIIADSQDPRGQTPRSVGLIHGVLPAPDSPIVKNLSHPPVPTKGRTLDHVGFEVRNLEAFCKKLEASGVKFDQPYRKTRHKSFASAEFTDRWGASIELTEGLSRF